MGKTRVVHPLIGSITRCKVCHEFKDDSLFPLQHGKRLGLVCRVCNLEAKRTFYATNPTERERAKAQSARWAKDNPEAHKEGVTRRRRTPEGVEKRRQDHINNREHNNERTRRWIATNKERHKQVGQLWVEKNKEKYELSRKRYYVENKRYINLTSRCWRMNNPGKAIAYTRAYMLAKDNRTPAWADLAAISKFYENCPQGYDVDHVVPLRGKIVSGLHVLNNLQYLPSSENRSKGRKFTKEDGGW